MNQQPPDERNSAWEGDISFPSTSSSYQPPFPQQGLPRQFPLDDNQPSPQPYSQQGYPPQQHPMRPLTQAPPSFLSSPSQKWYRTNAGIIALLIFFFPAGLYLMWKYTSWSKKTKAIVTGILAFCVLIGGIANTASPTQQVSPRAGTSQPPLVVATKVPSPTSTSVPTLTPTPLSIHYPPTTVADLHGLAAQGMVSAIHEFDSESVGLTGACPQPKREVTVDPSVTGRQLAEDFLAYFYTQQLDSPCGSIVFAYHTQAEANDVYTAGRINFDVTDASGASNVDPNATNLTYTLTLDIGGFGTGQEYVVTY